MTRPLACLLLLGVMCCGAPAFADDTPMASSPKMSQHKQMMKDCMAQQKAKDSNMSMDDVKQTCHAQMKMMKDCMAQQKAKDSGMSMDDMKQTCSTQMKMMQNGTMAPAPATSTTKP